MFKVSPAGAIAKTRQSFQKPSNKNDMQMLASQTLPIHSGVAFNVRQSQVSCKTKKCETNESGRSFEKLRALLQSQDPYVNPRTKREKITNGSGVYKWSVTKMKTKCHQAPSANELISKESQLHNEKVPQACQQSSTVIAQTHSDLMNCDQKSPGLNLQNPCSSSILPDQNDARRKRFLRTKEVLAKSGLLDVTMKTASLLGENKMLQTEIEQLKQQVSELLKSVSHNPENKLRTSVSEEHSHDRGEAS